MRIVFWKKIFIILNFFFFFVGFFLQENAAGGAKGDFEGHIYGNIILFQNYDFFQIPWNLYDSTSLPLYYLVLRLIIYSSNPFAFQLFTFVLSLLIIFVFYNCLKQKYNIKKKIDYNILFLCSIPLLSPYYRSSAFFGLEENIGYLCLLVTFYFYLKSLSFPKNNYYKFFSIFFSCLTFYTRQSYAFLPVIIFLSYFNFKKIFANKNIIIAFVFFLFLLPSLYFFYEFKGLVPQTGEAHDPHRIKFNIYNIPIVLSCFLFYLIPLALVTLLESIKKMLILHYFSIIIVTFVLYYIFFSPYIDVIDSKLYGGGVIYKLLFKVNFFQDYNNVKFFIFLLLSYLSILLIYLFSKKNINFLIYSVISLFIFSSSHYFFQEYFDPLMFFLFFTFFNFIKKKDIHNSSLIFFIYYFFLLISSLLYRNEYNLYTLFF
jgi:hypothetical protein